MRLGLTKARLAAGALALAVLVPAAPGLAQGVTPAREAPDNRRVRPGTRDESRTRPDALTAARRRGRLSKAEYSLERARSLFSLGAVRNEYGRVRRPDSHDATMILRDLVLNRNNLSGADARAAKHILARPTDGSKDPGKDGYTVPKSKQKHDCFNGSLDPGPKLPMCLHWVTASNDKATANYVAEAKGTLQLVATLIRNDFGFRKPRSDAISKNHGPNENLDVYLADIGGQGVYGYCTSDEPRAPKKQRVSAYCVLDNNYSPNQFDSPPPEVNGTDALWITTAHEYFHAVQFAYDWKEARWLMEGSAVAMEDEIFDEINAHLAFIDDSAIHQPEISLDAYGQSDDGENFEYGAWLFFRFMSEFWCRSPEGGSQPTGCSDPHMTKAAFEEAEVPGTGAYNAVAQAFLFEAPFGYDAIAPAFALFGVWNYGAWDYEGDNFYEEIVPYREVIGNVGPPLDAFHQLSASGSESAQGELLVDGMSTRYVSFWPGYGSAQGDLTVTVNVPPGAESVEATLMRIPIGATIYDGVEFIGLDAGGQGQETYEVFDQALYPAYSEVVLVLSNAGRADNVSFSYSAQAETDQP